MQLRVGQPEAGCTGGQADPHLLIVSLIQPAGRGELSSFVLS